MLISYIVRIDLHPDDSLSNRRQGYPRKSCNIQKIYQCHKECVQRYLWHEERHHWGQVWRSIWTYEVWNFDITCRNKEDVKSQSTRKRSFSIQYAQNGVQGHPGMEMWRVVIYECNRRLKNLAGQAIEVEWRKLILLLHIGWWQLSSSRLPTDEWVRSQFQHLGKNDIYFEATFEFIDVDIDGKTNWMI